MKIETIKISETDQVDVITDDHVVLVTELPTNRSKHATLKQLQGNSGASAYEIAVRQGFEGTETEWVESLQGTDGSNGKTTRIRNTDISTGDPGSEVSLDFVQVSEDEESVYYDVTGSIPKGNPGSGAENAVQFIPQSLTPAQQAQARENIGAGEGMINVSGWAGTFQLQLNEVNNYLPITTALSVGDNIMINGYITNWGGITTAFSSVIPMLAAGVVEGWYLYNDTPNGSTVELDDPLQAIAGRLTIRTYGISNETRITGIYLMPKALQT